MISANWFITPLLTKNRILFHDLDEERYKYI